MPTCCVGLLGRLRALLKPEPLPTFRTEALSLIGPRRENQDNYLVIAADQTGHASARWLQSGAEQQIPMPSWPARWVRLVVLDGMGGHQNGREIAEAAATELRQLPPCTRADAQYKAIKTLHGKLRERFTTNQANSPGSTLVWAEIDRRRRRCYLAHLGDSRIFLGRGSNWQQLTHDHTLTEFSFRDGHIDAASYADLRQAPHQRIAQALGYGSWGLQKGAVTPGFMPEVRLDLASDLPEALRDHADCFTLDLPADVVLLLASDGLWNAAPLGVDPNTALQPNGALALARYALNAGGSDNTTLILGTFSEPVVPPTTALTDDTMMTVQIAQWDDE